MTVDKGINKNVNYVDNAFFSMFILKGFDILAVCFCCPLFNKETALGNSCSLYISHKHETNGAVQ